MNRLDLGTSMGSGPLLFRLSAVVGLGTGALVVPLPILPVLVVLVLVLVSAEVLNVVVVRLSEG